MDSVHVMWLFAAVLPCFIGISFCIDCQYSAVPISTVTVSSSVTNYGKDNLDDTTSKPWVGEGTARLSNWVNLDFPKSIILTTIEMTGGSVDLYNNGSSVTCFVERFFLYYKNETGESTRYPESATLRSDDGNHTHDVDLNGPIKSVNITIKRYTGCPAVNLKLIACGVCMKRPPDMDNQSLNCINEQSLMQQCTYSCIQGFESSNSNNGVKSCDLNGSWSGADLTCRDKDECTTDPNLCGQFETCENTLGSYRCPCRTGFSGKPCTDIDECNLGTNLCNKNAICEDTPGSYKCKCRSGYTGDGYSCKDIDECNLGTNLCNKNATCKDTPGSYSCKCRSGYTGDGYSCKDVNECDQNKCHKYADCTNTFGSFKCKCWKGFNGNGTHCIGRQVHITKLVSENKSPIRFGEKLELKCQAKGLPNPSFRWEIKDSAKIVHSEEIPCEEEYCVESTVVVNSTKMRDEGVYKCTASNKDSGDEKEIVVEVIGTAVPPQVMIGKTSSTSVNVSWKKPTDEGASSISSYTVHYKRPGGQSRSLRNVKDLSAEIKDLESNTEYVIWVDAINEQGHANNNVCSHVVTLAPKPDTPSQPKLLGVSTASFVKIQFTKLDNYDATYEIMVEVIIELVLARPKRDSSVLPETISDYDKAMRQNERFYTAAELQNEDNEFVVGDGKMYGSYKNAELQPGTTYNIYTRGVSYNKATPKMANIGGQSEPLRISTPVSEKTEGGSDGSVVGIAVGVTVAFIVLVLFVLVAVFFIRSRRPKTIEIDPETGEKKGKRRRKISSELMPLTKKSHGKRKSGQLEDGAPDPNHPPVPISGLAKYVAKLHKSDDRGFMIQYNTLDPNQVYTSEVAASPENKDKNRYANIVAYDDSRVPLKLIDDDENSSYINASLVDGYNSPNAYIATQGPLPGTFNDFWRMVWEKNCSSIVMLTNLQERHKLKCHKYWPEESEKYGDITVTSTRREEYADYVIRTFLLKMVETEEEREVKQFHFTVWPDHGVPEYPTAILAFQRRVRAYSTRDSGPLAVHCSAGVGRSGTFIVIDCMLARIQNEQTIDIYNYVRYLRTRRMFMVQTEEQYVFCHDALLESILCGNTQMAAHNLRIEMNRLRQRDATTKITGYESEFKTLNKVSPSLPRESFVVATYPQNVSKNRYPDILASDHGRVILGDDDEKEDGPYINAVYVDGYKQQNAFILTQAPLKDTIKDFWQMLYEKHSACVLLLCDLSEEEGEFPQFWPDEGLEVYEKFNVELVSDVAKEDTGSEDQFQQEKLSNDLVERKLKITKEEDKSLAVKMFQHLSWKEATVPSNISAIISLIQRIEKWQQRSGNGPITVVCNDGQSRSGTFAALCSVLERVKTEQVVDVFQTIKALRTQRPGLVKHVDQYQFIHLGVQEYLDSFSDYANFK